MLLEHHQHGSTGDPAHLKLNKEKSKQAMKICFAPIYNIFALFACRGW
jgi:hypothetical protein